MLDIKLIRTQPDAVRKGLADRGGRYLPAFEDLLAADQNWRACQKEVEDLRTRRNKAADEVGAAKRDKKDVTGILKEMEELKKKLKELEESLKILDAAQNDKIMGLPNLPHASVPVGKSAANNKEVRQIGERTTPPFVPKDHQEIGEHLGILDFARAAKLSGARFSLLVGDGARLERALIQFMLDLHTKKHGYIETFPPFLVTRQTMTGTGQLPKFEEELYACKEDDLFLIPTAEVPLTNIFRDEAIDEDRLPKSLCAYTACFRREAGSYGKDTRGLIRNHQFNKIELVRFAKPEDSLEQLELLTSHAEEVLKQLKLPYRVLSLCSGDIGFSSAKTYDLEVWMPGDKSTPVEKGAPPQIGSWREISSCSTFTDFQARRINIRVKRKDGSRVLLHTLNGSGVAVGRAMAAILENYQQADGSVKVPEALKPYMGQDVIAPRPYL
jgi:seryl-tRNA synthetase